MSVPLIISPAIRIDALGMPVTAADWSPERCHETPRQVSFPLNEVEPDAVQIVARIQQFSIAYGKSECVFAFARCLTRDLTKNNDLTGLYSRVAAFVLDKVVYVPDPRGAEFVRSPVQMIREYQRDGYARGDCDDMVLLANSLFSALGFPVKCAAVMLPGATYHNHVVSLVKVGATWHWFDACNKDRPNQPWTGDIIYPQ